MNLRCLLHESWMKPWGKSFREGPRKNMLMEFLTLSWEICLMRAPVFLFWTWTLNRIVFCNLWRLKPQILLLILLLFAPDESLIGSLVLTTPEPVTKGEIGLLDLKLKLRRDRERLELGVRTGVSIGVLSEEWMLKLKTDMSVDRAGEEPFSELKSTT